MFKDIFGNTRYKIGLHTHTTFSDGKKTPEETAAIYKAAGYDAIALTDHWYWRQAGEIDGLCIISGAEYDCGGRNGEGFMRGGGVYHITALGALSEPAISRGSSPREMADAIHAAGGIAVLAHPAWSLNDPAAVAALDVFDATEIYNTVSGVHYSFRPDSSAFCDMLACRGKYPRLLAADDAHYYDGTDDAKAAVCVRADTLGGIITALSRGDFYATLGPEVHLHREDDRLVVDCSPAQSVSFCSNCVFAKGRVVRGEGLTHAEYILPQAEGLFLDLFVRVEVTDALGRRAWTNYILI